MRICVCRAARHAAKYAIVADIMVKQSRCCVEEGKCDNRPGDIVMKLANRMAECSRHDIKWRDCEQIEKVQWIALRPPKQETKDDLCDQQKLEQAMKDIGSDTLRAWQLNGPVLSPEKPPEDSKSKDSRKNDAERDMGIDEGLVAEPPFQEVPRSGRSRIEKRQRLP